jgi:hypothetical protein
MLIDSSNQIKWLTWTRFPAAKLRFINASPDLAKRKIAKSTKNLDRAVIVVQYLAYNCYSIKKNNAVSHQFACVTLQRHGSDKMWECVTAWKALSHANAKVINSEGWVRNQVFRLAEEEKKKRRSEISGRDLQKTFWVI